MQPEPLLELEVGRLSHAFAEVSRELGGALRVLAGVEVHGIGTRAGETAVATGVTDLRSAITDLESVADEIRGVLTRHQSAEPDSGEATPRDAR